MTGMENLYPSQGQPRDPDGTDEFRSTRRAPAAAPGGAGPAGAGSPTPHAPGPDAAVDAGGDALADRGHSERAPAGLDTHLATDRRKALHWAVGLTVAVLLAVGGILAGLAVTGHSAPDLSQVSDTSAAGPAGTAGPTGQAALLDAALSAAGSPSQALGTAGAGRPCAKAVTGAGAASGQGVSPGARRTAVPAAARCRLRHRRLARFLLLNGVDGQFTFRTRQGTRTLAYERGVIVSVNPGTSVEVRASDGTTWTWTLVSRTVVRDLAGTLTGSALTPGTPVWVGGPVVQGAKDARLIVVNPPSRDQVPAPSSTAAN